MNDLRFRLRCPRDHERTPENTLPDGACRLCHNSNTARYYIEGGETTKNAVRKHNLKHLYGLTRAAFLRLILLCDNRCQCGREFGSERENTPCVDHDHKCCAGNRSCGKCIRGLLCRQCNLLLGVAKDNPHYLPQFLSTYITRFKVAA